MRERGTEDNGRKRGGGGQTLPPPPWEKPGGSGMEGDGLGRDMGKVLKSMTQAGEGGGGMRGGPWGAIVDGVQETRRHGR